MYLEQATPRGDLEAEEEGVFFFLEAALGGDEPEAEPEWSLPDLPLLGAVEEEALEARAAVLMACLACVSMSRRSWSLWKRSMMGRRSVEP